MIEATQSAVHTAYKPQLIRLRGLSFGLCGQGALKKHKHSVDSALRARTSWLLGFQFAIDEITNQGKIDFRPTDGAQLFEIFVKKVRICTRIALD